MTDLPERARGLAKQFITEQNETYSPETREEEEAELSKLASLILTFGQAERERTIEETVAAFDNAKCLVAGQEEQCPNTRIPCPVCMRNKVLDALKERRDAPKR
jgi:hypothetical protein